MGSREKSFCILKVVWSHGSALCTHVCLTLVTISELDLEQKLDNAPKGAANLGVLALYRHGPCERWGFAPACLKAGQNNYRESKNDSKQGNFDK